MLSIGFVFLKTCSRLSTSFPTKDITLRTRVKGQIWPFIKLGDGFLDLAMKNVSGKM